MAYTATTINGLDVNTPQEGASYIPEANDAAREIKLALKTTFDVEHNLTTGMHHLATAAKTGNYTLTATDTYVEVDASGGAVTITIPNTSLTNLDEGHPYIIKKVDSSSNAVTWATTASQTVDGLTTGTLTSQHQTIGFLRKGSNWKKFIDSNWVAVPATVDYKTYACPATEIANGDYLILGRFTVPAGKTLSIKNAGIKQSGGSAAPASVLVRCYNVTDASVVYSTGSDYATVTGTTVAAGKEVYFDVNNGGAASYNLVGFIHVEVA